jgi:hypothetical protein
MASPNWLAQTSRIKRKNRIEIQAKSKNTWGRGEPLIKYSIRVTVLAALSDFDSDSTALTVDVERRNILTERFILDISPAGPTETLRFNELRLTKDGTASEVEVGTSCFNATCKPYTRPQATPVQCKEINDSATEILNMNFERQNT